MKLKNKMELQTLQKETWPKSVLPTRIVLAL